MQTLDIGIDAPSSQVIPGESLIIRLSETPKRYYWHGWQSWSLAYWADSARFIPPGKPYILHPLQIDPVYATHPRPHGSWVGAVELADGRIILLGALGTDAHVELNGGLKGTYDGQPGEWLVAVGDERAVFADYARELAARLGSKTARPAPRVWCSWYSLYESIDERELLNVLRHMGDLPFDVVQVDDGWQRRVGDWEPNRKFPSGMQTMQERIRATDRHAGIWLAPLVAVRSSRLFHDHPDWFLRDERGHLVSAGLNWGEPVHALDTTHPLVTQYLKDLIQKMRAWGYRYLKLDFLYAGALPGLRRENIPREQAYRHALHVMRDAMGDDAYFLACGAPIIPTLGLCDALRIGPDVAGNWESHRDAVLLHNPAIPGARNSLRTTMNRLWLKDIVQIDPDVAYFSASGSDLTLEQRDLLKALALICGFKATSDLPVWLTDSEREQLRQFLKDSPRIARTGRLAFSIGGHQLDFSDAIDLPSDPAGWSALQSRVLGWVANQAWALQIDLMLGRRAARRKVRKVSAANGI